MHLNAEGTQCVEDTQAPTANTNVTNGPSASIVTSGGGSSGSGGGSGVSSSANTQTTAATTVPANTGVPTTTLAAALTASVASIITKVGDIVPEANSICVQFTRPLSVGDRGVPG